MSKITYVTSRPVVNQDNRETTAPSLEELVLSRHPEVAQAARKGQSFDFGKTRFWALPKVDLPAYSGRLRLFSLPGMPCYPRKIADVKSGVGMTDVQRLTVEASVEARKELERSWRWSSPYEPAPTPEAVKALVPLASETDLATTPPYGVAELPPEVVKEMVDPRAAYMVVLGEKLGWAALAVGIAIFSLSIGWIAGQSASQNTVIARPVCDPATGACR